MRRKIWAVAAVLLMFSGCDAHVPETTAASTVLAETTVPVTTVPPVTEAPETEPLETVPPTTQPPLEGWQEIGGQRYFFEAGIARTGWLEQNGGRYYFREDGVMAQGKVLLAGGEARYFTSSGKEVILVNPWNFVPEEYTVELEKVDGYKVSTLCADALRDMLQDCKKAGHSAVIVSAYRTHDYQAGLFQRRIDRFIAQGYDEETAKIEAAKRVAYPGTSEHELGLAVDIVDKAYQNLNEKQETMPAQKWLMEHCWEYGFILRYPNEKSDATGIIYEPWHYRYVGTELAEELKNSGLCLEEYLDLLTAQNSND